MNVVLLHVRPLDRLLGPVLKTADATVRDLAWCNPLASADEVDRTLAKQIKPHVARLTSEPDLAAALAMMLADLAKRRARPPVEW